MNAVDILKYGHLTVQGTIEGLPEEEWVKPDVCGVWSVKDIMAHLASYEHLLADVLQGFLGGGGPTPYLDSMASDGPLAFNDVQVGERQHFSIEETIHEYNEAQAKTMELIAQISAETCRATGSLPWYGSEYSLDDFLVYTFYGHKREHCAQIAVFRDTLK